MKKILISVLIMMMCMFSSVTYATGSENANYFVENETFHNEDIEQVPLSSHATKQRRSPGFYIKEEVVKQERKNWVFCGYAVPTWQKASSYSSGKTYSASIGYKFYGVSTTLDISKTASATIPADPNRWSRLGCYADITFKKVKVSRYQGGHPKPVNVFYRVDKIYHNKYLSVVYK